MKIGSLKEFKELKTMDFTVNGKCSNCGECCSTLLPVSGDEIKQIRQYIRKHHIKLKHNVKAPMAARTIDLTCPFLDVSKEHKCMIYEVRPLVCSKFICSNDKPEWSAEELKKRKPVSMRRVFK